MSVVCILVVLLRIIAVRVRHRSPGSHDYACLLALVSILKAIVLRSDREEREAKFSGVYDCYDSDHLHRYVSYVPRNLMR